MTKSILRQGLVLAIMVTAGLLMALLLTHVPVARGSDIPTESPLPSSVLSATDVTTAFLPIVMRAYTPFEVRALWVSRYDWIDYGMTATVADVQRVVSDAAYAGFNTLFFQVRGAGDAYYTPGPEPWAARLTGSLGPTLGRDPGFDPLATMISLAHASGISVHAYINVYPAWLAPPSSTYGLLTPTVGLTPPQWLNQLTYAAPRGIYGLGYKWRVYDTVTHPMPIDWGEYTWASPAVPAVQDSVLAVTGYLLSHYTLDGIHLDYVRYPGPRYSFDPFTLAAYDQVSNTITITDWRGDFQRAQVSGLVARIYTQTTNSRVMLSAAVWPRYAEGRADYFQDSKAWLMAGTMDAIAPMMYTSDMITDVDKWTGIAQDFQSSANGRWILPGIGVELASGECVGFENIASRIQAARLLGTAGQAIFSYGALRQCEDAGVPYFDLLRQGPYAAPAHLPPVMRNP